MPQWKDEIRELAGRLARAPQIGHHLNGRSVSHSDHSSYLCVCTSCALSYTESSALSIRQKKNGSFGGFYKIIKVIPQQLTFARSVLLCA